jgi:hypothetical protein
MGNAIAQFKVGFLATIECEECTILSAALSSRTLASCGQRRSAGSDCVWRGALCVWPRAAPTEGLRAIPIHFHSSARATRRSQVVVVAKGGERQEATSFSD